MTADEIEKKLVDYITREYNVDPDDKDFGPEVHLFNYGYIDSFRARELVEFIEGTFSIHITNQELMTQSLNTIREMTAFISRKTGGAA